MASPSSQHSTESTDGKPESLAKRIDKLADAFDAVFNMQRQFYEARMAASKSGAKASTKLTLPDGTEIDARRIQESRREARNALRQIPRVITEEKKREKAERRARRGAPHEQKPIQFMKPLIDFFNTIDLGTGVNGKRLQDQAEMALFFKNGVGQLTFGVSLLHVWSNLYKIHHKTNKVVLSDKERSLIKDALVALRGGKVAKGRADDLKELDAGVLQSKDYMTILSHYRNKDAGDLSMYSPQVATMRTVTKERNEHYRKQLQESKPKPVRVKPTTPVRKSPARAAASAAAKTGKAGKLAPVAAAPVAAAPAPAPAAKVTSPRKSKK